MLFFSVFISGIFIGVFMALAIFAPDRQEDTVDLQSVSQKSALSHLKSRRLINLH